MENQAKAIQMVEAHKLTPNPKNPNKHPPCQIERLAKLIDYQGFRNPIIVSNRSGFIVVGHGRLEAAKKLGLEEVPVIYQDFADEVQEYAYVVSDNTIADWADTDLSMVNTEMLDLGPDFDIDLLGIKDFTIEPIEKYDEEKENDVPDAPIHAVTTKGDVWLLGGHRVMCGDSTMIDEVEKLMDGQKADMVFTDPPYGMKLDGDFKKTMSIGGKKRLIDTSYEKSYENIKGDHEDFSEELINIIFTFSYASEIFIFGADYFAELLPERNSGSWVVWDKRLDDSADKMFGSTFELCWSMNKHKRETARIKNGIFGVKDDSKKRVHPTQKPVQLSQWFFEKWCKGLVLCVDLYLGSGSTLIACEKTNRKCYGMELDEKYCDVIVKRWQDYTGKEATLESSGVKFNDMAAQNG